jgi:2'-5' RNA ligase
VNSTVSAAPLIITALPDPAALAVFTDLRHRHFPPARNIVPAHISLFHQLPGDELARLVQWLTARLADHPPLRARTGGLRFLGRGVAIGIDCDELLALHAAIAAEWRDTLIPQDRQPFQPHVTIQNKAEPAAARALFEAMQAGFQPLEFTIIGIRLWRYLGGPWEEAATVWYGKP